MHERDSQHADTHAFLEVADRAIGRIRTKARVKAAEEGAPLESPLQGWPSLGAVIDAGDCDACGDPVAACDLVTAYGIMLPGDGEDMHRACFEANRGGAL